jgi:hypothetical protein
MMKRMTYVLATSLVMLASVFGFMAAHSLTAHAQSLEPKKQACEALGVANGTGSTACDTSGQPDVNSTLKLAINAFSLVVGFAAVIMIIVGGFKYVTSQGESANTAGAKNTILYALVGLVVVALAQVIVRFVLTKTATPATLPSCPVYQTTLPDGSPCKP